MCSFLNLRGNVFWFQNCSSQRAFFRIAVLRTVISAQNQMFHPACSVAEMYRVFFSDSKLSLRSLLKEESHGTWQIYGDFKGDFVVTNK